MISYRPSVVPDSGRERLILYSFYLMFFAPKALAINVTVAKKIDVSLTATLNP